MLLVIDVGNTNTVFAVCNGGELLHSWRLQTQVSRAPDEYIAYLSVLFDRANIVTGDIQRILISSVVPDVDFSFTVFCERLFGVEPAFVTKDMVGVDIDLERPDEVGADRLVNAVAVLEHYSAPAIVIDFGTATTFDVIDANGAYAGGVIAPGIHLSMTALHQAASKLPKVSVKKPDSVIGKRTSTAMQAGVYFGYKGLLEGIVRNISAEMDEVPYVIATGGLASMFEEDSDVIDVVDRDLTLKGLLIIDHELERKA